MILTQGANGILKPIARLLGLLMNGIYVFLDNFLNIQNIALTIIIFTVVIYLFMLPLTYQQQKFSKMSQIMNPEIQKIQKKYKNRKDSASVQAMNEETQAVYKKYGVNPSGSCIFMVIQLLILFPLYRIIYNVPGYVTRVRDTFTGWPACALVADTDRHFCTLLSTATVYVCTESAGVNVTCSVAGYVRRSKVYCVSAP